MHVTVPKKGQIINCFSQEKNKFKRNNSLPMETSSFKKVKFKIRLDGTFLLKIFLRNLSFFFPLVSLALLCHPGKDHRDSQSHLRETSESEIRLTGSNVSSTGKESAFWSYLSVLRRF